MATDLQSFDEFLFYADNLVDEIEAESTRIVNEARAAGVLDFVSGFGDPFGFGEQSENWDALPIALDKFTDKYPRLRERVVATGDVNDARALALHAENVLNAAYGAGPAIDFGENVDETKAAIIADAVEAVNRTTKALEPFGGYGAFVAGGALAGVVGSVTIPVVSVEQRVTGLFVGAVVGAAAGAGIRYALGRLFTAVGLPAPAAGSK